MQYMENITNVNNEYSNVAVIETMNIVIGAVI